MVYRKIKGNNGLSRAIEYRKFSARVYYQEFPKVVIKNYHVERITTGIKCKTSNVQLMYTNRPTLVPTKPKLL